MRQGELKQRLVHLAPNGRLSHAYILECSDTDHWFALFRAWRKNLLRIRKNVHTVCADGLSVKDKAIEELCGQALA